jgi:hypothetical protein
MVVTDYAKKTIARFIGNSGAGTIAQTIPSYFVIGSGSGTSLSSMTTLLNTYDRQAVTSTDITIPYKVSWTGDWNSVELSGLSLKEFGMIASGTGITGSIWSRTGMPAIQFDGTNELRIEETWEVF